MDGGVVERLDRLHVRDLDGSALRYRVWEDEREEREFLVHLCKTVVR